MQAEYIVFDVSLDPYKGPDGKQEPKNSHLLQDASAGHKLKQFLELGIPISQPPHAVGTRLRVDIAEIFGVNNGRVRFRAHSIEVVDQHKK